MPGPGKKPAVLKSISGTVQPCRADPAPVLVLPALVACPEPLDWLPNAHAVKEWVRLAPILVANALLNEANLSAFGHMCALHGKIVQLYTAGEAPTGHMIAQYRNLINDFGLTPVAQGKVKAVDGGRPANRFATNGKRTA